MGFGLSSTHSTAAIREQTQISVGVLVSTILTSIVAFNMVLVRGRRHCPAVAAEFARREAEAELQVDVAGVGDATAVHMEMDEEVDPVTTHKAQKPC